MPLYIPGLNNPMTTGGDIIYGGAGGVPTRLANGSATQVLTSSGGTSAPTWTSASSIPTMNVTAQTTPYPATINDYITCSGASFPITLPTAVGSSGKSIIVKHDGTSLTQVYQINTTSGQTMIGSNGAITSGNLSLYTNGEVFTFTSNGANWEITDHITNTPWTSAGTAYVTSTSAYVFTVTAANATVGATYSNNGQTFTVTTTIAAGVSLTMSGTGLPTTSGTLTKVTGTGDATIIFASRTVTGVPAKGSGTELLQWQRRGNRMLVNWYMNVGAGTAGSGDYLITIMPAGAMIDLTGNLSSYNLLPATLLLTNTAAGLSIVGPTGQMMQSASAGIAPMFFVYSPTQVRLAALNNVSAFGNFGNGFYPLSNNPTVINLTAEFPIAGWQP